MFSLKTTLVLFLLIQLTRQMSEGENTLQIAVFPEWFSEVETAMIAEGPFEIPINLTKFSISRSQSAYNDIREGKLFLEKNNIHAIVGPWDENVATATEELMIPYLCTTPEGQRDFSHVFHLHPPIMDFSRAILDLAMAYDTRKISLVYDSDAGLNFINTLISEKTLEVKTWRIQDDTTDAEIRDQLVSMRTSRIRRRVVVCSLSHIVTIFEQASDLAMLSAPNEWFFYDPGYELEELIFHHIPSLVVNFTIFSIVRPTKIVPVIENRLNESLVLDAVMLLANAINETLLLSNSSHSDIRLDITDNLQQISMAGYSGHVKFDSSGKRTDYDIYINGCYGSETFQIATWNSTITLESTDLYWNASIPFPLEGKEIPVVMILEKPFTMLREGNNFTGNDRFEGFTVDLLIEISKILNFTFNIYLVHDGNFGSKTASGEWNGIIGELLAGNATMSVAPLSINAAREQAVDFTKPFMNRYINVLLKVPRPEKSYFEFLYPIHFKVYICVVGAFAVVSICLFVIEKHGISTGVKKSGVTLKQSLWFIFGSLLQGSTDVFPVTLGGRILSSSWWFFVLILVSSYTANLAAFLTVKNINSPVQSVSDLVSQAKIKYGTVKSSAALSFFETTAIETFSRMASQMLDIDPSVLVNTSEDGFKRVMEGNYAFLWDSTVNKYMASENCLLTQIGPEFAPRGFGIGVPPGASYLDELSMTILRLSDLGTLNYLEEKWWKERSCEDFKSDSDSESNALLLKNVAGIFFILGGGIALAMFISLIEFGIRNMRGKSDVVTIS